MKNIRRNFVVEYKTGRRSAKASSGSIWGNVDLKALARDVESQSLLADIGPRESDLPAELPSTENPAAEVAKIDRMEANAPAAPRSLPQTVPIDDGTASAPMVKVETPRQTAEEASEDTVDVVRCGEEPLRASRGTTRRRNIEASGSVERDDDKLSVSMTERDELRHLELENRRLKRLMVAKLRSENDRLRSMLRRFGTA